MRPEIPPGLIDSSPASIHAVCGGNTPASLTQQQAISAGAASSRGAEDHSDSNCRKREVRDTGIEPGMVA